MNAAFQDLSAVGKFYNCVSCSHATVGSCSTETNYFIKIYDKARSDNGIFFRISFRLIWGTGLMDCLSGSVIINMKKYYKNRSIANVDHKWTRMKEDKSTTRLEMEDYFVLIKNGKHDNTKGWWCWWKAETETKGMNHKFNNWSSRMVSWLAPWSRKQKCIHTQKRLSDTTKKQFPHRVMASYAICRDPNITYRKSLVVCFTIGCPGNNMINLYNSMHHRKTRVAQISSFINCQTTSYTMQVIKCQKQSASGCNDCGLFAISTNNTLQWWFTLIKVPLTGKLEPSWK